MGSPEDIDALYGLEPVIDLTAGQGSDALERFVEVECPYCAESLALHLDLSAGEQIYVEDCQVCCQPIQIGIVLDDEGALESVTAERLDR